MTPCIEQHSVASWKLGVLSADAMVVLFGLAFGISADAADDEKAKVIVANVCSACHGMDGNSTVPTFPKLAGRHPEYLARELRDFITGKRKSDIMVPIVAGVDPNDFKALGAYFGAQKPTSGTVTDPLAAAAGKKIFEEGDEQSGLPACAGCHEQDAAGNKKFPRLAGQHREYLVDQMQKFKQGARSSDTAKVMREVVNRLDENGIKAVAEYLTGL